MLVIMHPLLSHGSNSLSSLIQVAFFPFSLIPEPNSEPPTPTPTPTDFSSGRKPEPTAWPKTASRAGWFVLFLLFSFSLFPLNATK